MMRRCGEIVSNGQDWALHPGVFCLLDCDVWRCGFEFIMYLTRACFYSSEGMSRFASTIHVESVLHKRLSVCLSAIAVSLSSGAGT